VPNVQTVMLFMATALALNLTPGPSILFILSRCLGQGRKAAVASVWLAVEKPADCRLLHLRKSAAPP